MERYIGEVHKIYPKFSEVEILWITVENVEQGQNWTGTLTFDYTKPSMWFKYKGWIYYCVCDYNFNYLEDYSDWEEFNEYRPSEMEFDTLMQMNPTFYKLDYIKAMSGDLGKWCDYELDFIKVWWRDSNLDYLLGGD